MTPISLLLRAGAAVKFNYLYPAHGQRVFSPDILLVRLSNGTYIDVGWYPEDNPDGWYLIRAYRGDWRNQLIDRPLRSRDPQEVADVVSRLAEELSGPETSYYESESVRRQNTSATTTSRHQTERRLAEYA